jgi:hypothetical protein
LFVVFCKYSFYAVHVVVPLDIPLGVFLLTCDCFGLERIKRLVHSVCVCVRKSPFLYILFELHIDGDGEEGSNLMANGRMEGVHCR